MRNKSRKRILQELRIENDRLKANYRRLALREIPVTHNLCALRMISEDEMKYTRLGYEEHMASIKHSMARDIGMGMLREGFILFRCEEVESSFGTFKRITAMVKAEKIGDR